ncbi:MAG: KH domain-containing protein [bacterium]|nr:KH domain-containing protein [bacterium]
MDTIQIIGTSTQELLAQLKIPAKVAVSEFKDDDDKTGYNVEISGDELGVLIGYHGETLNHLQQILSLIVNNKLEEWVRVIVDIDGWRLQRKEAIAILVQQAVLKVRNSSQSQVLPPMSAHERRIVHTEIIKHEDMTSHSEGEGLSRKVIIEQKKD